MMIKREGSIFPSGNFVGGSVIFRLESGTTSAMGGGGTGRTRFVRKCVDVSGREVVAEHWQPSLVPVGHRFYRSWLEPFADSVRESTR